MSTYINIMIIVKHCLNQESMSNRLTVRVLKNIGLSMSEIGAHLELLLFLFTENKFSLPFNHFFLTVFRKLNTFSPFTWKTSAFCSG